MTTSAIALGVVLAILPSGVALAAWPVYGHDLANSRSAGKYGPSRNAVPSIKQAWAFKSATGDFTGTPVVAGGVLVAGNNGGWVYGLSAATGKVLWSREVGGPVNGSAAIDLKAPGGPLAMVAVAKQGSPRLEALSLKHGTMRWKTALSHQATATTYGSPTYWRGRVYMGTSGPNGDQSTARGSVVALQEGSGRMRWRTYTVPPGHDGGAVWSTPAIDRATGRLYVGTGNAYHAPVAATTDSVLKMDATTGRILDHFQGTANDIFASADNPLGPDADFGASPNLIAGPGGRTLVGEGAKSGIYWALRRHTLHPAWKTVVGPGSAIGGILGSTAYDGARVYGTDAVNGKVWALGRNGSQLWSSADAGPLDFSPVAVANGVLYSVSPQGALIARDSSTGAILNQLNLAGPTFGGASVARRAIYVAVGIGPPPPPAPQSDGPGSIVAFGQTARSHPREFRLRFSKRAPRRPVGMRFHWFLHRTPDSPTTKPSPLRTEVVDLPRGARFDGSTLPACQATNAQLQQTGPSGCPASSEVGSGTAILMSGLPSDPVRANVTVFNWGNGTIEVITQRDTGATLAIDRGTFTGPNELTNHPPRGPGGPPDFQTVLSQIDLTYSKIRGRHRSGFITTPPRCPRSGRWKSRISYSTADGHGYRRTSTTPCRQLRIGN